MAATPVGTSWCSVVNVGLLRQLPAELRVMIYKELFPAPLRIHDDQTAPKSAAVSLLRTCRAIHAEAAPILYDLIVLPKEDPEASLRWLRCVGSHLRFVHKLRIPHHCALGPALGGLRGFPRRRGKSVEVILENARHRQRRWVELWMAIADCDALRPEYVTVFLLGCGYESTDLACKLQGGGNMWLFKVISRLLQKTALLRVDIHGVLPEGDGIADLAALCKFAVQKTTGTKACGGWVNYKLTREPHGQEEDDR